MAPKHVLQLGFAILLVGCATQSVQHEKVQVPPAMASATAASDTLASIQFTLHDNRLLVDVFLNGQGPFVMIFDTGGANTLTPEVMRVLELRSQGEDFATGAGAGAKRVPMQSVHLQSMQVGGYKLENQKFMVINLDPIRKSFRFPHLDGIIGFELLQEAKVRLDMDHQLIQLVKQDAQPLPNAMTVPFQLVGNDPVIEGKINDSPARILLDTGDRSNLTLFRKFAHSSELEHLFDQRDTKLTGMGIGGPIKGKLASMFRVDLGSVEVKDVVTRLPLTKSGYFHQSDLSASAGMGLLKAFNMEFDYKKNVVALQRRKDFIEQSTFVPVPVH